MSAEPPTDPRPTESVTLMPLAGADDWAAFHAIRKAELFAARGRGAVYDSNHPDDRAPDNVPMLLRRGDEPIGVVRLDFFGDGYCALRLLAIRAALQGTGLGSEMIRLAVAYMRKRGVRHTVVNAATQATAFYRRAGFREQAWTDPYAGKLSEKTVQMVLDLGAAVDRS